ncbi:NDP-hexose 2,3-dehydratase family protein [Streptomyces acidiscabies]|uniref:NDP-hexose 2,3-dehydratase family protein n=1 Tax=Streptomyces acidiscabies TaxID=42234 RepID=A0AAP6BCI7_9ACTN|nr:NDP-hexose 2,3-dehydratase family protein [Streptomyces acidiscabies]MBP5942681.1 NDP-hexose 2,3-dehydratase [Streptomyces sp. LBUM 1476]MBZ3917983.1 NDP-hexose 2,3-dehydratase family protein [Streptomyces acidiscabies]MDX2961957.1 NDP-hexose 2,3-dehydratase family protein [Streptomyces acidiscabies]MDX3021841.1 NDP-hexose 2,3-dehydratase family protein [Streptomyces acidiscabies]MDX3789498.1 NDP-hexose 2,3-dehydratase family protein [Streptomyces acidiscabies]
MTTAQRPRSLAGSALTLDSDLMPLSRFHDWFAERTAAHRFTVGRIPFAELDGWSFAPDTGNLGHDSGRFFTVEGLSVQTDRTWISSWVQPIIVQPEIGVLGILAKEFDGVHHFLMQAKMEPGNVNGLQLSPTVQATRSNYTGVHGGRPIKYLQYFRRPRRGRVLADVLQSEQGAWFLHKRNRNMIVETDEDVPLDDDFCWLTLAQIRQLLRVPNLVNMDARTVLSCIPPHLDRGSSPPRSPFAGSLHESTARGAEGVHGGGDILSWLTEVRAQRELVQRRVPLDLAGEGGWIRESDRITHRDGLYFDVVAVGVEATSREVGSWTQPLFAPLEAGLLALLVKQIDGVLHALVEARTDAGLLNVAELAPTVQCQPVNYRDVPPEHRPRFLDHVLSVPPQQIRFDVLQSEEGGRFHHAQNRYVIVEVGDEFPLDVPEEYRWLTVDQLGDLLQHSNYLNVELRSCVACLQALRSAGPA